MFCSNPSAQLLRTSLLAALGIFLGCITPGLRARRTTPAQEHAAAGVPAWAIHIPPPTLDVRASLESLEARLLQELALGTYQRTHVSPEQLASLAVRELREGHTIDAAVLLALASFRRLEQVHETHAEAKGNGRVVAARWGAESSSYLRFIETEAAQFQAARFDDEIERVAAKLGSALNERHAQDDLLRIVMGNLNDQYGAIQALKQRSESASATQPEQVYHPALASAVRAYLEGALHTGMNVAEFRWAHLSKDEETEATIKLGAAAARYLARVPMHEFRVAALREVPVPFDGLVVRAGLRVYARQSEAVVGVLGDRRAEARAHAALILGMTDDVTNIPALEAAQRRERDPRVRLALAFALLRLGESDQLEALMAGLRHDHPLAVEYAVMLINWLPLDLQLSFDEFEIAKIITGARATAVTRFVGAMVLRDLAVRRPLAPESVQLLLRVARSLKEYPIALEHLADAFADLEQLDHEQVLAAIRKNDSVLEPWMARFARVARPDDLALLDSLLSRAPFRYGKQGLLLRVIAAIPGAQAQALLQRWFRDNLNLRDAIALQLVLRRDLDKASLRGLMKQVSDVHTTMFALAFGAPDADLALARYVASDSAQERYTATLAIKFFGRAEHRALLWGNARYHDARYYPAEVRLRQLTLSALIDLELNQRSVTPVAPVPKVTTTEPPASASSALPPPSAMPEEEDDEASPTPYSTELIQSILRQHKAQLRSCWAGRAEAARCVVRWRVSSTGSVEETRTVHSEGASPETCECLAKALTTLRFPAHPGDDVVLEVPFNYGPVKEAQR